MQILVTHGNVAKTRVLRFSALHLGLAVSGLVLSAMLLAGVVYHFMFFAAARDGWPVVNQIVQLVVRDQVAQRDRYMRENLDAMARRVGEMQAKLIKLEAMGERVASLAGIKPTELRPSDKPGGKGGPYLPVDGASMDTINAALASLDRSTDQRMDVFSLIESRLFESRLAALMVPSSLPVDAALGSHFGIRTDPFTGQPALHAGLDFPADPGTPIHAAAGGVVVSTESHPAYGNVVEIDHGNNLVTRYAHASRILVKTGDIVRRGQIVAEVGNTGRSTGPHLHFEVLVDGVHQDPAKFLFGTSGRTLAAAR
jgi:murein DD-endopeptidase MepM/ murein hydrolase activator NlpD